MKVLVVDDHPLLRNAVAHAISTSIDDSEVIQVGTVAESIASLEDNSVDIVALDLRLDDESGLDVARYITSNDLRARCVVFTSVITPQAKMAAFETESVTAFLEKGFDADFLVEAIVASAKGFASLTLADYRAAEEELRASGDITPSMLTPRESEIADLVGDGLADSEIAEKLFLATSTVRNHLQNIYAKVNVDSRNQLQRKVNRSRNATDGI